MTAYAMKVHQAVGLRIVLEKIPVQALLMERLLIARVAVGNSKMKIYDSVQNSIDICPETSHAEVADSVGCGETQRDSDGDFVNDYWDVCAATGNQLNR